MPQPNIAYRVRNAGSVKIKVLIVDDHKIIRDGIKSLLETRSDIEVVGEAENGQEAYDKVMELRPDVVLMDIVMPVVDGIESTRHILRDFGDTKIVIVSQYADEDSVRTAIWAGVSGYLPKTAGLADIVQSILSVYRGGSYFHYRITGAVLEDYRRLIKADLSEEGVAKLTPRESNILRLIVNGYTSLEIAKTLDLSVKTVSGHRDHMMHKLRVRNSAELTKYAMRKGIISVGE